MQSVLKGPHLALLPGAGVRQGRAAASLRCISPVALLLLLLLLLLRGACHPRAERVEPKGVWQPRRGPLHHLDAPRQPSPGAVPVPCCCPHAVQLAAAVVILVAILARGVARVSRRAGRMLLLLGLCGGVLVRPGQQRGRRQGRRLEAAQAAAAAVMPLAPAHAWSQLCSAQDRSLTCVLPVCIHESPSGISRTCGSGWLCK